MTNNEATRKRHRVADLLRIRADELYSAHRMDMDALDALHEIADQIDREHERRMDQAREDSRKATCNYMSESSPTTSAARSGRGRNTRMDDLMRLALLLVIAPTCWHDLTVMEDMR